MKTKRIYLLLTIICFLLCILIVKLFSNNPFIRGFLGDVLVMALLYFVILIFINAQPKPLAISILLFAFTLEFLQYFQLVNHLGLKGNRIATIVIGSTFDPIDLLAYAIGTLLVYFFDVSLLRKAQSLSYTNLTNYTKFK